MLFKYGAAELEARVNDYTHLFYVDVITDPWPNSYADLVNFC